MKILEDRGGKTLAVAGSIAVASQLTDRQILELSLRQYIDPLFSSIRETGITNPADACIKSGKLQADILVHIHDMQTVGLGCKLVVQDSGCGMSPEFLQHEYFSLGRSTAAGDELLSGGFGVGAKAILAIADFVHVRSVQNGVAASVTGQLIDAEIRVSQVRVESTSDEDGTRVTVMLPSASSNQVYSCFKRLSVFIGLGSTFNGHLHVTKYDANGVIKVATQHKRIVDLRDLRLPSCVFTDNYVALVDCDDARYIRLGGMVRKVGNIAFPNVKFQLFDGDVSIPKRGVVWNNAYYTITSELALAVDEELDRREISMRIQRWLNDTDSGSSRAYIVFQSQDQLAVTSDRSALKVNEHNVDMLVNKLLKVAEDIEAIDEESFTTDSGFVSVISERILRAQKKRLVSIGENRRLSGSAGNVNMGPDLFDWRGPTDLLMDMCWSFGQVSGIVWIAKLLYSNPRAAYGYDFKVVSLAHTKPTGKRNNPGALPRTSFYNGAEIWKAIEERRARLQSLIVVAAYGESQLPQNIGALKPKLHAIGGSIALQLVFVPADSVDTSTLYLQGYLEKNFPELEIEVLSFANFSERIGTKVTSTLTKRSRFIKDQVFVWDSSELRRSVLPDTEPEAMRNILRERVNSARYPDLELFVVRSDGVSVLNDLVAGVTPSLGALNDICELAGVVCVGAGESVDIDAMFSGYTLLNKDDVVRRIRKFITGLRYADFIDKYIEICKKLLRGDESRSKSYIELGIPECGVSPYRAARRFLGVNLKDIESVRKLTELCTRLKATKAYSIYRSDDRDKWYRLMKTKVDSPKEVGEVKTVTCLIYLYGGKLPDQMYSRLFADSAAVRRLELQKQLIDEYVSHIGNSISCYNFTYEPVRCFVKTAPADVGRPIGPSVQLVLFRKALKDLVKFLKSIKA